MRKITVVAVLVLVLAACGGDDGGTVDDTPTDTGGGDATTAGSGSDSGTSSGGEVMDMQPPGQATASVDGEEYTFDTVGPVGCEITDTEINAGFILGDNDVSFVAGGSASGSEWRGRIDLNVQTADGIANYFADFSGGSGGAVAVDGASMSYSGEWQVFRPGASDAESVGEGILSFTCG